MILMAPDTEREALRAMAAVLAPEGRLLIGYALSGAPAGTSRTYPVAEFVDDCGSVGLAVESRFASYDLRPFTDGSTYVVHVLRHA
jgi:hypothetical protein